MYHIKTRPHTIQCKINNKKIHSKTADIYSIKTAIKIANIGIDTMLLEYKKVL